MVRTKIALTNHRKYVILSSVKKLSTITTYFNELSDVVIGLTKRSIVKNNKKFSEEKISEIFEYF